MIIDTTEVQAINSFSRLESLKEVYGIIWALIPIFTPILGITIGVLVIIWLEREIFAGIQQRIGPEYVGPLGILQALADGTNLTPYLFLVSFLFILSFFVSGLKVLIFLIH